MFSWPYLFFIWKSYELEFLWAFERNSTKGDSLKELDFNFLKAFSKAIDERPRRIYSY